MSMVYFSTFALLFLYSTNNKIIMESSQSWTVSRQSTTKGKNNVFRLK